MSLRSGLARQQLLQIAQQKVDVQAAFVRLVDNEGVVLAQQRIAVYLGQQDAVRHQFNDRIGSDLVVKSHLVADQPAQLGFEFDRDAGSHRTRRDATRLGMTDAAQHPAPQRQTYLGQLRGLARTGLAADDEYLVLRDRARQILAPRHHRQIGRKFDFGQ